MPLNLYDYQQEAHDRLWDSWHVKGVRCPAVVMATGAGKTHVIASLAERWHDEKPKEINRVLVVAHRKELIEQAAARLRKTGTRARIGIVKGARNEVAADLVVGSVQTLAGEHRRSLVRNVGLIMVDECHHATASTYKTVMGHYGALPDLAGPAVAAGFTATMTRSDRSNLGSVWTDIPFSITMSDLVRRGFLVPPITYHCRIADLDLTKIRKSAGDYVRSELGRAVQESIAPGAVVRAYERHAKGRVALLFTPTVALAEHMAKVFADAGYRTDTVDGKTPERKRESIVSRCRAGRIDILTNCGVFTEGTDLPNVGCIIMMRPTKSTGLFIQMAGRGARLDPNDPTKEDYILIDVCGVTQEHTLSGSIDLFGEEVKLKKKEDDEEEFIEEVGDEKEEELEIGQADGPIESILVDIMSPKRPSWRQTPGGAWFLQRKNRRLIAIVPSPEPGKMDVVEMGPSVGDSRMLESGVTSLADCMRIGEIQLTGHEKGMVAQGAKWRSRKASYQLIRTARTFGHTVGYDDIVTAGELEEFISIKQAERRIDPCVMKRMQAVKRYCG